MAADLEQPIIVKKVKGGGHGHHGGAWKVAFADFAVAMMAFFLLMWLLATTTTDQQASISAYFNDPLATTGYSGNGAGNPALEGGDGILDGRGSNPFTGQSEDTTAKSYGDPSSNVTDPEVAERERLQALLEELRGVIEAGRSLEEYADQLLFDITEEGLRIQIVDQENRAMFDTGSARLQPYTKDILDEIVKVINQAPNRISISGHTDATPYATDTGYGNWELSADRANAARRALIAGGLPEDKVGRVVGLGASDLLDPTDPLAPVNRRISIVVLRGDYGKNLSLDGAATPAADAAAGTTPGAEAVVDPAAEAAAPADAAAEGTTPAAAVPEAAVPDSAASAPAGGDETAASTAVPAPVPMQESAPLPRTIPPIVVPASKPAARS